MAASGTQERVGTVSRAVGLLMVLRDGPKRLGDVSAAAGLSKPTAHRILSSLKATGMVMQDPLSGEYALGPTCYSLMTAIVSGDAGMLLGAGRRLEQLRDETGETITVHVRAGRSRICIQEYPSSQPIRYTEGVGSTVGIHVGSAGKVLLAFMPEAEREKILEQIRLTPLTSTTITDLDVLREELAETLQNGYAISRGERAEGAMGISAPILDSTGDGFAFATLSVLGPAERVTEQLDVTIKRALTAGREVAATVAEGVAP
ncbi:MAG: IclR family transcriptional regulator [Actinobacteria bacterium]|nr:IclR family transcriptional regulator [Actinomycetota bacterium]